MILAQGVIWASLMPSTRVSYNTKIQEFLAFRGEHGLPNTWPIPPEHLMRFLLHLSQRGLAPRSMMLYLGAISFSSKALGWADATADFRVRRMVEGFRRGHPLQAFGRKPITPSIPCGLCDTFLHICSSEFKAALFRAVVLTLFWGAFRPGEVLAVSKAHPGDRIMKWEDCQLGGQVSLLLRKSKADQRGYGRWVHLRASMDRELCPCGLSGTTGVEHPLPGGWPFRHLDDTPLARYQFGCVFFKAIACLNLPVKSFGLHSFRIGAASTAGISQLRHPEDRAAGLRHV